MVYKRTDRLRRPSGRRDWGVAIVSEATGRGVRVETQKEAQKGWLAPADVTWARAGKGLSAGDLVFVEPMALSPIHISQPTRLRGISYAVFCLEKKKKQNKF